MTCRCQAPFFVAPSAGQRCISPGERTSQNWSVAVMVLERADCTSQPSVSAIVLEGYVRRVLWMLNTAAAGKKKAWQHHLYWTLGGLNTVCRSKELPVIDSQWMTWKAESIVHSCGWGCFLSLSDPSTGAGGYNPVSLHWHTFHHGSVSIKLCPRLVLTTYMGVTGQHPNKHFSKGIGWREYTPPSPPASCFLAPGNPSGCLFWSWDCWSFKNDSTCKPGCLSPPAQVWACVRKRLF